MEQRFYKRIDAIIAARFSADSSYYVNCLGTIMNISESGMRIETCKCLPLNSNATLYLHDNEQVLHVPFKVVRIIKDNKFYSAMGIEIMQASQNYLKYVEDLKSLYSQW